jgi:WD40 repeat protein
MRGLTWLLLLLGPALFVGTMKAAEAPFQPSKLKRTALLGDPSFRHGEDISHIVVLPDGKRVLTSAQDGHARLWDLTTGKQIQRYQHANGGNAWNTQLVPGGKQLVTSGSGKRITLWDLNTGKSIRSYKHGDTVYRVAVSRDGSLVAGAEDDGAVIIWELATGKQLKRFKLPKKKEAYTVLFAPDGKTLTTGGTDDAARVWDRATGVTKRVTQKGTDTIYTLVPSPDDKQLLVCCGKGTPRVWRASDHEQLWQGPLAKTTHAGAWSPDGKQVAVSCTDNHLYVFEPATGKRVHKIALAGSTHYAVAWSPDGKEILCGTDHLVCRFDAVTGKRTFPAPDAALQVGAVGAIMLDVKAGEVFHSGGKGLHVRELKNGRLRETWLVNEDVEALDYCAATRTLLVGGDKGAVKLLDARSGKLLRTATRGKYSVDDVALSRDGTIMAACEGETVTAWRVKDGSVIQTIKQEDDINALAFAADGSLLVTTSDDKQLRLWDLHSGRCVETLKATESLDACAAVGPHQRMLVARSSKRLYLWNVPEQKVQPRTRPQIEQIIRKLGARSFRDREAAAKELAGCGTQALDIMRAAAPEDPEIAMRLAEVRTAILRQNR